MCLLIFAHRLDPRYPLVLAANRDEFHARATAPAQFWGEYPYLLAGRDLEQGGTWMGITRDGRFAAITNYRDPARTAPAPRSRGELPLDYLTGRWTPEQFVAGLGDRAGQYAGFNLLLGAGDELWYYTNSPEPGITAPRLLPPGLYGLSNASLDTPWPKVERGKRRLRQVLAAGVPDHEQLAGVVGDRELAAPGALQRQGLDNSMDRLLSAQFIVAGRYGTRSTTTLWTTREGLAHWRETSFDAAGAPAGTRQQDFTFG